MDIFADLNTTVLRRYPFFIYHNITNMIPEPEYIKIDRKYAWMLFTLSMGDKAILFDRILEWHLETEYSIEIEDDKLRAIYGLLTLDFE